MRGGVLKPDHAQDSSVNLEMQEVLIPKGDIGSGDCSLLTGGPGGRQQERHVMLGSGYPTAGIPPAVFLAAVYGWTLAMALHASSTFGLPVACTDPMALW